MRAGVETNTPSLPPRCCRGSEIRRNGLQESPGRRLVRGVFKDIYPLLAAKKKPILIGEMASAEAGGDKGKWIDDIIPTLRTNFPNR
jgi:hypothetical protein